MMNNDDLHLNKISQQYDYSMQNLSNSINQNDDSCMELLDKLTFDDNSSNFITNSTNSSAYMQNNIEIKNDDKFCQEIMLALEKKDFTRILTLAISQSQNGHKMDGLLSETIQEIEKSSNKQVDVKIIEKLHSLLRSQPKSVATATPLRATVAPIRNESIVSSSSSNMSTNPGFRSNNKSSSSSMKLEPIQDDFLSLISSPDCKPPSSGTRSLPATPPISQVPNRPLSSHCVPIRSNERKPRTETDLDLPVAVASASANSNQPQYCSYTSSGAMPTGPQMQYVPLNMSQFASQYPHHHHHHQSLMAPNIVLMPMINAGTNPGEQAGTVSQCVVPQPGQVQMTPLSGQLSQPASQSNQISLLLSSAAFFSMANSPGNQGATITTSHDGVPGPTTIAGGSSMRVSSLGSSGPLGHGSSNLPKLLPKPQQPLLMPRTSPMGTTGGYGAQLLTSGGLLTGGSHQQQHHLLTSSHMGGPGGPGIMTNSGHSNGMLTGVTGHGGQVAQGSSQQFKRPTSRKSSSVKTARNNSSGSAGGGSRVSKAAANRSRECGVAAVVPSTTNKDNVAVAWEIAEQSGGLGDDGVPGIVLLSSSGSLGGHGPNVVTTAPGEISTNNGTDGLGQFCDSITLASNGVDVHNNHQMDGLFEQHTTDFDELFDELVSPPWSLDQPTLMPCTTAPPLTLVRHATIMVSAVSYEDATWSVARLLPAVSVRHASTSLAGALAMTASPCRYRAPLPQSRCLVVARQSTLETHTPRHDLLDRHDHDEQLTVPSAALLSSLRGVVSTGAGGLGNAVVDSQRVMQLLYVHLGGRHSAAASLLSPLLKCLLPAATEAPPATTLAIATGPTCSLTRGHMQSSHNVVQVLRDSCGDKSVSETALGVACSDSGTVPSAVCSSVGGHTAGQHMSRPLSVCTRLSEQDELTEDDLLLTDISPVKRDPAQLACLDRFLESCHHESLSPPSGTHQIVTGVSTSATLPARCITRSTSVMAVGALHRRSYGPPHGGYHGNGDTDEQIEDDQDDDDIDNMDNEDCEEDELDQLLDHRDVADDRSHPLLHQSGVGGGADHFRRQQIRRHEPLALPFQRRHDGDTDLSQYCGTPGPESWLRKTKARHRGKWALNGTLLRCSKVLEVPESISSGGGGGGDCASPRDRSRFLRKKSTFRSAGVVGQHKQHRKQHHRLKQHHQLASRAAVAAAASALHFRPRSPFPTPSDCYRDSVVIGNNDIAYPLSGDTEHRVGVSAVIASNAGPSGLKVRIRLSQLKVVASTLPVVSCRDNRPTASAEDMPASPLAVASPVPPVIETAVSSAMSRLPRLTHTVSEPSSGCLATVSHSARQQTSASSTKRIFCTRKEDRRSSALQSGTPGTGSSTVVGPVTTGSSSPSKARKTASTLSSGSCAPSPSKPRVRSSATRTRPATLPAACLAAAGHPPLILKLSACRAAAGVTEALSPPPPPPLQHQHQHPKIATLSPGRTVLHDDATSRSMSPALSVPAPLPGPTGTTGSLKLRLRRSEDRVYLRQDGTNETCGATIEESPHDPGGSLIEHQSHQHQQPVPVASYEFSAALQLAPPQLSRPRPQLAALQFSPAHSSSDSDVDVTHNEISSLLQRQEQRDPLLPVSRVVQATSATAGPGAPVSKPPLPGGATPGPEQHAGTGVGGGGLPVPYLVGSEPMVFIDPHECDLLVVRNSKYKRPVAAVGGAATSSSAAVSTASSAQSLTSRRRELHGDCLLGSGLSASETGPLELLHHTRDDTLDPSGDLTHEMLLPGCFVERDKDSVGTAGTTTALAAVAVGQHHEHSEHKLSTSTGGTIVTAAAASCWNTNHSSPPMPVLAPQEPFTTAASTSASIIGIGTDHISVATATAIRPSPSSVGGGTASHPAVASSYDYSCQSLGHHSNQSYSDHHSDHLQQSPLCMSTSVQNPLQSSQYSQSASSHNEMRPDHKSVGSGSTKSPYQQHQHSSYYQQQQQQQQQSSYNSACYLSTDSSTNVANPNNISTNPINSSQSHSSKSQLLHQSSPITSSLLPSSATTCSSQHIQQQQDYAPYFHNAGQSLASSDTAAFSSISLSSSAYHPHLSDMHQSSTHSSTKRSSSGRSHPGGDPSAAKKRKEALQQQQQQSTPSLPNAPSLQLPVYGSNADLYNAAAMSSGQYASFDYYNGFSDIMSGIDSKLYEQWTRELCPPMPWVAEYCKQAAVATHLMPAAAAAAAGFSGLSSGGPSAVPNPLALQTGLRASAATVTGSSEASDYSGGDLAHAAGLGPDQLKPLSYLDQYTAAYMAQPYMYSAFGAMPK